MRRIEPAKVLLLLTLFSLHLSIVQAQKLTKVWEKDGFVTPESIISDDDKGILYVSNIGSSDPTAEDGTGFISKMKPNGDIIELKWATGLNAPKGMTIYNNQLVVSDINKLVFIDRATGKIIKSVAEEKAVFLNDLVNTADNEVIVSDSRTGTYYKLNGDKLEVFIVDKSFTNPNGLYLYNGIVYAGVGDRVVMFTDEKPSWKNVILETGPVDGITNVDDNSILISAWTGQIHIAYTDKPKVLLLDTSAEKTNTADFYFDHTTDLLYVPNFFGNKVVCYEFEK